MNKQTQIPREVLNKVQHAICRGDKIAFEYGEMKKKFTILPTDLTNRMTVIGLGTDDKIHFYYLNRMDNIDVIRNEEYEQGECHWKEYTGEFRNPQERSFMPKFVEMFY